MDKGSHDCLAELRRLCANLDLPFLLKLSLIAFISVVIATEQLFCGFVGGVVMTLSALWVHKHTVKCRNKSTAHQGQRDSCAACGGM